MLFRFHGEGRLLEAPADVLRPRLLGQLEGYVEEAREIPPLLDLSPQGLLHRDVSGYRFGDESLRCLWSVDELCLHDSLPISIVSGVLYDFLPEDLKLLRSGRYNTKI